MTQDDTPDQYKKGGEEWEKLKEHRDKALGRGVMGSDFEDDPPPAPPQPDDDNGK